MRKLLWSFTVISDVYTSFIPNNTTYTKYGFTHYLVNFMGLVA